MADSPGLNRGKLVTFTIKSEGNKIDGTYRVESIKVQKEINKIPTAKIVLFDGSMPEKDFPISNKNDFKPGAAITIDVGYENKEETIYQGIIVKHGIKIRNDGRSRLILECKDKAVKMTVGRKNGNFVNKKDSEIITSVIGSNSGLSSDVKSTNVQHKEIVQYYSTDWDFVLSRAEVNGFITIIDNAKLSVKPPETSSSEVLKITYGEELIEFNAEMDARSQLSAVKVTSWDPKTQKIKQKEGSAPSLNSQGNLTTKTLADVAGLKEYTLQSTIPMEDASMKSWADAQMLKSGLARIIGQMKFQGNAKAKPGSIVEVEGVGDRFKGKVYLTSVTHTIIDGDWISEAGFGLKPNWFSENRDIVAPPASGLLPGIEGLQIGVVTKLDEDPEAENKIQVKIPVLHAETEGVWARLTKFYASNGIGSFFIPEIGDEVVLGYLNNDPRHPIIVGSVYSSKNKPPYNLTKENYIKALVTKTKMKVEFDEEKKIITIVTPGKNSIVISDDKKSITLEDQNKNKIEMSPDGIKLDSPKDIKINAKGQISINAMKEINVTSKMDVKVSGLNVNNEAKVGFTAKGNATAELSASGQTTVKGAIVMIN